jgi:hypothetical protein
MYINIPLSSHRHLEFDDTPHIFLPPPNQHNNVLFHHPSFFTLIIIIVMPAVVSNATRIWELNINWELFSQCGVWDAKGRGVDIYECIRARTSLSSALRFASAHAVCHHRPIHSWHSGLSSPCTRCHVSTNLRTASKRRVLAICRAPIILDFDFSARNEHCPTSSFKTHRLTEHSCNTETHVIMRPLNPFGKQMTTSMARIMGRAYRRDPTHPLIVPVFCTLHDPFQRHCFA